MPGEGVLDHWMMLGGNDPHFLTPFHPMAPDFIPPSLSPPACLSETPW